MKCETTSNLRDEEGGVDDQGDEQGGALPRPHGGVTVIVLTSVHHCSKDKASADGYDDLALRSSIGELSDGLTGPFQRIGR
ncbi:MAG: hypothetical protein QOI95_554 [Acidimicrobiaceae bacterium]